MLWEASPLSLFNPVFVACATWLNWKRGFFGWEYKGKHKDLDAAYDQLLRCEALENPPLLVVCDMDRFVIHTNFIATAAKTYEITSQVVLVLSRGQ